MIKFYCVDCGKEMWQGVIWDAIKNLTIEEVKNSLICSDCVAKRIESDIEEMVKQLKEGDK